VRAGRVAAVLAFAAEVGHLAAAVVEAPAWPLIAGFHVVAAGLFGCVGVGMALTGRYRTPGLVLAASVPGLWWVSRVYGLPTYLSLTRLEPTWLGAAVTLVELALAAALLRSSPVARAAGPATSSGHRSRSGPGPAPPDPGPPAPAPARSAGG